MILIRADGGPSIGSGHIMRCMTIANQLQKQTSVLFVTDREESKEFIESRGFLATTLAKASTGNSCEEELPQLLQIIQEKQVQSILVDSYRVSTNYLEQLNHHIPVIYMDDEEKEVYPVSCVINYNSYADEKEYALRYKKEHTKLLIGTSYVPLRREFTEAAYSVKKKATEILITTGGGDQYNIAGKLLDKMMQFQSTMEFNLHIVSGIYNQYHETLKKEADQYPQVRIYENVKDIWNLMAKCDMAITAGGSTTYELCAIGVPMIGYIFADNQKMLMEHLEKEEVLSYCGDFRIDENQVLEQILQEIKHYESQEVRETKSRKAKEMVDCQGAARIARELLSLH